MSLKKINQPELFQGNMDNKHYFEGWYFKHATQDGSRTVAFIPGISLDTADRHSFIQVILSPEVKTYYFKFPIEDFKTTESPFSVTIGENVFSMTGCKINVNDHITGMNIKGTLHYADTKPIRKTFFMPNIMGFFAYIPKMECNHGVLSMTHQISGHVAFGESLSIDFTDGKGYIEKDWGTSFPSAYIWIQANHFEGLEDSFMCSIANIPFGLFSFSGLIANLHYQGEEFRFATYNRTKIKDYIIEDNRISFELIKGDVSLKCEALLSEAGALKAPQKGEMLRTIKEGLGGEVTLVLNRKGKAPVTLRSGCAGIEVVK